jgi:Protein of unknown function DUF262
MFAFLHRALHARSDIGIEEFMALADEVSAARKRIFRDGYDISFGELVSLYEKNELIIQPEYQRLFRWDQTQKTRFMESLLLNIPIPPIFVFSDSKGRWELVDGLQRVSTVLEFIGKLRDADGNVVAPFSCDGTGLIPSLKSIRWPRLDEEDQPEDRLAPEVLPQPFRLGVRRARIRVEILGQETDAQVKYELFQRLNSGGTNLSEQELRNCIVVSISKHVFDRLKSMASNEDFLKLSSGVGEERAKKQFLVELVVRFIVLRNYRYETGLDVHEYLDQGIMIIAGDNSFDWELEEDIFVRTMKALLQGVGVEAFSKNNRFSLAMFEFISLGLSKAIQYSGTVLATEFVRTKVASAADLPQAQRYSGSGVRGTQRLSSFVFPFAERHFAQIP